MTRVRTYSHREEMTNSLSHALGIVLGLVAGYFLISKAKASADPWAVPSVLVYLFGMLSSYVTSTYYHYLPVGDRKQLWQKFDHAAIYLHIAGTYTPLTLLCLRHEGYWGWGVFAFVWLFALVGVIASFKKSGKHSYIETVCYVVMGSSILVALKPLIDVLETTGKMPVLWWLLAGGASYFIGAVFYSLAKVKYMHTVFHIFVLGGSICHIMTVWWTI